MLTNYTMHLMKHFVISCLFFYFSFSGFPQSNDSIPLYNRLKAFSPNISKEEIATKLKNSHLIPEDKLAQFYVALGNYQYVITRDLEAANKHFYFALDQTIISQYTKADALNGIGTIYSAFFHNDLAIKNFKKALNIIKTQYPDSVADINSLYNNIGHSFSNENLKDSARYYFRKGINFGIKNNSPAMGCYFNMGYAHSDTDSAYYYTQKALEASIKLKKEYLFTFCYLNLGANEVTRKNYTEADSLLNLSEANALKYKQTKYINEIKTQRARILIAKNQHKKAIDVLNEVVPYFVKINDYLQLESIYLALEEAYTKSNDYKNAHLTIKKYYENITRKENSKKLKKDKGVDFYKRLEKKLASQKDENATQKKLYWVLILLLLLFFSVVIYLFGKYKKGQQQKALLFKKRNSKLHSRVDSLQDENIQNHQQLLFKNLLVDEKQSFLKQLAKEVKTYANSSPKNNSEFLNIYKKIKQNINDTFANEFEYHFEKVHPNFYKSFTKKNFDLSKNEMRLAALIKLNFNTKEISEITKQSTNTINVAKSRLKTKLNLEKNDSLYSSIQNIDK